jgi:hypothetical protein
MVFEVPASCTLPTARRPVRVAELEALLATAISVQCVNARHLGMSFAGADTGADTGADIVRAARCRERVLFLLRGHRLHRG